MIWPRVYLLTQWGLLAFSVYMNTINMNITSTSLQDIPWWSYIVPLNKYILVTDVNTYSIRVLYSQLTDVVFCHTFYNSGCSAQLCLVSHALTNTLYLKRYNISYWFLKNIAQNIYTECGGQCVRGFLSVFTYYMWWFCGAICAQTGV